MWTGSPIAARYKESITEFNSQTQRAADMVIKTERSAESELLVDRSKRRRHVAIRRSIFRRGAGRSDLWRSWKCGRRGERRAIIVLCFPHPILSFASRWNG